MFSKGLKQMDIFILAKDVSCHGIFWVFDLERSDEFLVF